MRNTIFSIFLLLSVNLVYAQTEITPDKLVKDFFETYKTNKSKALDNLYASSIWAVKNTEGKTKMLEELTKLSPEMLGEYIGYDPLFKKDLAERFILQSYLVRYDRQPLRFVFQFYKPKDKWVMYNFYFDSNLGTEIDDANKVIHNLK